jgi:uncharacterized protein YceK
MSFKVSHYLTFIFNIATGLFLALLGILALLLIWIPGIREGVNQFVIENSIAIFFIALTLITIGCASIAGIVYGTRKHYYSIKGGIHPKTVNDTVFHDYLTSYWKKIFPKYDVPCSVTIKNNKVHITADLPYIPREKQKSLVEQMEQDITDIFTRYLGYPAEYRFNVSFLDKVPDESNQTR